MYGKVDRRYGFAALTPDGNGDRTQTVGEFLVVDANAGCADSFELGGERRFGRNRVRPTSDELDHVEYFCPALRRQVGEEHLAHRRAIRRQSCADVEVEVDLPLSRLRGA